MMKSLTGRKENELICGTQTVSCLKDYIKSIETSK